MASIEKRGPYQWRAMVRRKGHPAQSATFETRKGAEAWAKDIEAQMHRGVFVDMREAQATMLKEALERYGREVTPRKKGAYQEKKRIARWQRDPLAEKTLAEIRGADIAEWRDRRLAGGASSTTARTDLALISHVYTVAAKEWRMEGLENPCRKVSMPKAAHGRERRLRAGEKARLLEAAADGESYLVPLIRLALETAMRQGELLAVRWEDIDLGRRVARLRDTKAGEPRDVPLSSVAATVLKDVKGEEARIGRVFPHSS